MDNNILLVSCNLELIYKACCYYGKYFYYFQKENGNLCVQVLNNTVQHWFFVRTANDEKSLTWF